MLSSGSLRCLRSPRIIHPSQCASQDLRYKSCLARSFHSSRSNDFLLDLLEPASQAIHWGFQELHTQTGLPWSLTIPLGATLIRTCWIPIQYLTQRARGPRETATQLSSAWRKAYQETARIKYPGGREGDAKKAETWVIEQLKARRAAIQEHNKYLPVWVEPVLAISFIPLWVLSMNCIRRMAGDERDIVSLIYSFFGRATSDIDAELGRIEPGFDTESLFWIPNLVSGDPLYILPIAYGALSTFSVWLRVKGALKRPASASTDSYLDRWARFTQTISYGLIAMPAFFTFAIIRTDMATALVLYLITITGTQLVQRPLLARLLGINKRLPPLRAKMARLKRGKENYQGFPGGNRGFHSRSTSHVAVSQADKPATDTRA